jgi:D-alanyl-D-alanine carboxypeptidase/D-alanyl-D-alanine-endopeptidase (penicillin-binding protein 4)
MPRITVLLSTGAVLVFAVWLLRPGTSQAGKSSSCLNRISSQDALLVASPEGKIIYSKNETRKFVPASTLKVLTGLAAIHHLGESYRFHTEFYQDHNQNLKVKGYGDPLLISEVWQEIAQALASRLQSVNDLVLDDAYFADETIPGVGSSTNPYDAPNGALCANFNTVFFKLDDRGRIVSAESQTPMTPLALKKIRVLGLKKGRYAFSHRGHEAARHAGELLAHFLEEAGNACQGEVRAGAVIPGDRLVYTYFMANEILIALGAHVHGPPGTLAKGVRVLSDFSRDVLHLSGVEIAEGSGISRKNRLSALDMLAVLKRFEPYRALLVRDGRVLYKTGSLRGIGTRAGYVESRSGDPYYFVIFLNNSEANIDSILNCVKKSLDNG